MKRELKSLSPILDGLGDDYGKKEEAEEEEEEDEEVATF